MMIEKVPVTLWVQKNKQIYSTCPDSIEKC